MRQGSPHWSSVFLSQIVPCRRTHETLFKWKPREMNTVDFLAKRGPKKWILHVQERGNLIIEAELTSGIPAWMTEGCDVRVPVRELL